MATGLVHLTTAMQHLSILAAGGAPDSTQQALGLTLLNNMLSNWEAAGVGGFSVTESVSGKSTTVATATNVITTTDIGGTKTTTLTKTAIAVFTLISTSNTYPSGWDEAIQYNLALTIAGPFGVQKIPEVVPVKAKSTLAAITPPVPGGAAA